MEIRKLTVPPVDNILAHFEVYIPKWGLTLKKMSLRKTKNGGEFVAFPTEKYEQNGEAKYAYYYFFDKEVGTKFQDAVKKLVHEELAKLQPSVQMPDLAKSFEEELPF